MTTDEAKTLLQAGTPSDDVYAFATVLTDAIFVGDSGVLLEYFEKPWKWADEFVLWQAHGHPANDEPEWEAFANALDELALS